MQSAQGGLSYTIVDPVELRSRLTDGESFAFVDARSPEAYRASGATVAGAVRLPPEQLAGRLREIPRGRTLVLIADPDTSESMAGALVADGFTDVWLVEGGFEAFRRAGGGIASIRGA